MKDKKVSILVVDDKIDHLECIVDTVNNNLDVIVYSASDYTKAIEILNEEKINILLTDFDMESLNDGIDLCIWTKSHYPDITKAIITSQPNKLLTRNDEFENLDTLVIKALNMDERIEEIIANAKAHI